MTLPPLFNPSNDMALAAGVRQYTPPPRIQQMEADLAALASLWDEGPWGWSLSTKERYRRMGIPGDELPTDEWLSEVRRLSSREFGVAYYRRLEEGLRAKGEGREAKGEGLRAKGEGLRAKGEDRDRPLCLPQGKGQNVLVPCQAQFCRTREEAEEAMEGEGAFILKAPWSSSGRGNIVVRGTPTPGTLRRIGAIVRQQGGILVEPFYEGKTLDFAMEFWADGSETRFLGYSVFFADETGHYGGNHVESQERLLGRIGLDEGLLQGLISWHKEALSALPYRGPVGIDMMRLGDGSVHPCVEVNFRMTMGLLAILLYNKGIRDDQLLTPLHPGGFTAAIHQGRLVIRFGQTRG